MKLKINSFLFLLLLLSTGLNAQNVQVTGTLKGFEKGCLVRVLVYADQFSLLEKTVATTRTDSAGNFRMSFPVHAATYAMLAVDLKRTGFYLKPDAVYHFNIAGDSLARHASPFEEIPLKVQLKAGDDSLNAYIGAYDILYNKLIINHFRDIYQFHDRKPFDNFKTAVEKQFGHIKSPYVRQYIHYSLASMVWGLRAKSLAEIIADDFSGKPVLYQNIQYTGFFNNFFQTYFESTIKKPVSRDKLLLVVPKRSLAKLDELFASVPALSADARVRQLAEMIQLAKYFNDPGFERQDIAALFKQIAANSRFPENRTVARDYLKKLFALLAGTPAPAFQLPDFTGNEHSLKDFAGKFVLLSFINTDCPVCNRQLDELHDIGQKAGAGFTNLTIVKGKITPAFMDTVHPTDRNWPFLMLGKSILLLEKYQVVTYPAYVLVDPMGRISMAPAPMPDGDLQRLVAIKMNAFKKRKEN